jgi:cation diffusion facilitator family transporter
VTDAYKDLQQGERGAWTSIIAYIVLAGAKLTIGYVFFSEALLADGLNNSTDIVSSIAVLIGLRISQKPPDEDHPYGHFRAETLAALIASFIMMVVGLQVLYQAVTKLITNEVETPSMIAAWTALACSVIIYGVYRYNLKLAKRVNSQAVMAAAQDNRSDALVGMGAFVGIIGTRLGLPWLDVVAAIVVGLIICRTAWMIFRGTAYSLSDGFDESELEQFKETINTIPGVERLKDIRARLLGNQVLVDVIVQVDNDLNVTESHDITERIERKMLENHNIEHVHIHIEPIRINKRLKEKQV